jgi:hypothetical protein
MPVPVFGPSEIDQNPNQVSLGTTPNSEGNRYWSNFFAQGAQAPARAGIAYDTTNADAARGWQTQMMQDLQRQAAGDPNSRAQQGLTAAYGQARAGQSALGSGLRGTGGGAGLRAGAQGAGNVQRGYAGDQQILMTQEKQAAQAQLAAQLAQMRGQDAMQAQGAASNAMGNQSLNDAMQQFYVGGGIGADVASTQTAADRARATMGFDLEGKDIESQLLNRFGGAAATAGATGARFFGANRSGSGYRQVDGQDSIVPDWDK